MDIRNGDLPCSPQFVQSDGETRETLPDGRVRVTRTVWFFDRRGDKDVASDSWIEEAAS